VTESELTIDDIAELIEEGLEQLRHFDDATPELLLDIKEALEEFAADWKAAGGVSKPSSPGPLEHRIEVESGPHEYRFRTPLTLVFAVDRDLQALLIDGEPYEIGLDHAGMTQIILEKIAAQVREELLLEDDIDDDE
jgi:hypothetical protein